MRLGHLSRLLLGPFSAPFFLDVGETGGGAPLNILALDSEVGIPVLGGGISNRWEKGRIRFRGIFLMDPFEIHIYIRKTRICKIFYSGCSIRIHFSRGSLLAG